MKRAQTFNEIDWKRAGRILNEFQAQLYKALITNDKLSEIRAINSILTSFNTRAMAVRKVVTNKSKNIPGIDKVVWKRDSEKMNAIEQLKNLKYYTAKPVRKISLESGW
jgi:RNA-directed DNA polymerase